MSLKKSFKKFFDHPDMRIDMLYLSAKWVFMVVAFLFFLAYFFVSAHYNSGIFTPILFPLYVSFVVSFVIFLSLLSFKLAYKKIPLLVIWGLCAIWIGLGGVFLFPVL